MKKINKFLYDFIEDKTTLTPYITRYYTLPERMFNILNILKGYPQSTIFHNKVTKKEAPNYHLIIKRPMDLDTIQKKIGTYNSYEEFKRDLDLIWSNCLQYNAGPYFVYCANILKKAVESAEIERMPVQRNELCYTIQVEGVPNNSTKDYLGYVVCRILQEEGYERVEKEALDILVDVVGYKILEYCRKYI